jgi:hypothetical protein
MFSAPFARFGGFSDGQRVEARRNDASKIGDGRPTYGIKGTWTC